MSGAPIPAVTYVYRATVVRVIDGDTVDAEIDLGLTTKRLERLRLRGVNTPERGQAGWKEATDFLKYELTDMGLLTGNIIVRTYKDRPETFGRYVADIWRAHDGLHINRAIIDSGYGRVA